MSEIGRTLKVARCLRLTRFVYLWKVDKTSSQLELYA